MPKRLWTLLAGLLLIGILDLSYAYATRQFSTGVRNPAPTFASTTTALSQAAPNVTTSTQGSTTSTLTTNSQLIRVVDGDTVVVRFDGEVKDSKIRLLGINTPEVVDPRKPVECFGKEASKRMHALVDGKRLLLKADSLADERDKYDRLLRNIYLSDGTDVNALLVREGYAYAYLSFPLDPARKRELKKLEQDARIAQRGLWSPQTCNGQK